MDDSIKGSSATGCVKKRYKMAMFDMDGTILDSYYLHAKCFQRFLRHYGVKLSVDEAAALMGNTVKVILSNTLPEERHEAALQEMSAFYLTQADDLIEEVQMIEGSVRTITAIRDKGLYVTLLTNSKKELVQRVSEKKGFNQLFDMIEAAEDNSLGKESRCKKILDRFGILPEDVLYVGDSAHDIMLARKLGMTGCLVDNEISWMKYELFSANNINPEIAIDDISKVLDII